MYKRGTWRVWQTGCRTIRSHTTFLPIDTLRRFNISLFFGIDIIGAWGSVVVKALRY